ncbi:MAG: hypothetical protein HOI22_12880 [Tateyamaria sp.]|nr:hypothetical protein [Tateyamaria sp.]
MGEYADGVVGKRVVASEGDAWLIINEDGTITGKINGAKLSGRWNWSKGRFCRNVRVGTKDRGTDCQKVYLSGNLMKVVGQKSKKETVYILQ